MNLTTHPFFLPVVGGRVDCVRVPDLLIGLQFVGVDRGRFIGNDSVQERGDLTLPVARSLAKAELPATLHSAKDGGFV
jgi:hypothetical protein